MMFDVDSPYALAPQVALRPERFGALAYHFGTRRLSFLKRPELVTVVRGLPHGLSERAIAAAKQIRFEPKKVNGVPVTVAQTFEYTFSIY